MVDGPRVLVSAWVGSQNLGDELVFAALLEKLRARDADVVVTSLAPEITTARFGVDAIPFGSVTQGLREIRRADLVVFGGGGLLQDATSSLSVTAQVWRLLAARGARTPVVAVGLGAGPLRHRANRSLVRAALGRHSGCSVRDDDSARVLATCKVGRVRLAGDLAVSLPTRQGGARDDVVVCLRPWASAGSIAPRPGAPAIDTDFTARAAAALDALARRLDTSVRLVAFERGRDDVLNEHVARAMTTPVELEVPDWSEVLDVVAGARVVVAMRYHAAIAALLADRPVAMLGYLPKVEALAAELGTPGVLLGAGADAFAGLDAAVDAALSAPGASASALTALRARDGENDRTLDDAFAAVTRSA